ncbi:MAG: glycosyltransferase family 4 protein [Clostridiales bacterium]
MVVLSSYPFDPRVRRQAEVLEKAGYNIDVICLRDKDQSKIEKIGHVTVYRVMKSSDKDSISKYILLSVSFFIISFLKILQLSFSQNYKLIEIHNMPDFLVFTGIIQKLLGKPVLLDMHDLSIELLESKWPSKRKSIIISLVRKMETLSCRFADHILTVTDACKKRLAQRGVPDKKITLILNTADPKIFKYDRGRSFIKIENGLKLVYHGTVAERFGIHTAIETVALLQKSIPSSRLWIYGKYDPPYRRKLETLIKRLNVEEFVFLNGTRRLEDIYEIIRHSDIGLVPYVNDPYMNLALSTKIFEYAASGLPVVASRLESINLIFDDKCLKFADAENPQSFASCIIDLCNDPLVRCTMSVNASKIVSLISGNIMGARYLTLIDSFT